MAEETDHLLDLPDEPQPLAASFADPQSSEGMRLIAKSEVLGTLENDDDIEWKPDPFEIRPDSVNFDSPDELLGMIRFEGSPEFQEKLRALCREYIDVFSTSVMRSPADVDPMENGRSTEVEASIAPPATATSFFRKTSYDSLSD